jgi:hypothetical protein
MNLPAPENSGEQDLRLPLLADFDLHSRMQVRWSVVAGDLDLQATMEMLEWGHVPFGDNSASRSICSGLAF